MTPHTEASYLVSFTALDSPAFVTFGSEQEALDFIALPAMVNRKPRLWVPTDIPVELKPCAWCGRQSTGTAFWTVAGERRPSCNHRRHFHHTDYTDYPAKETPSDDDDL